MILSAAPSSTGRCFDGLIHGFYGLFLVSPGCAAAVDETNAALRGLLDD